jgi:chromodomain-helicase-DNA-binding protein 1
MENSTLTNEDAPYDSESDLSEVAIPIVDEPSPASSPEHQSEFGTQDTEASESSAAEAQDESDDADFDMEDSPPAVAANPSRGERSTSVESRRPPKRKLGLEDEHILANPELYGLRRSVCNIKLRQTVQALTCSPRLVQSNTELLYVRSHEYGYLVLCILSGADRL